MWKASTKSVVDWLTSFCAQLGILEEISTDSGPEFTCDMIAELMKDFGIHHRKSSAYRSHLNLCAEFGVEDMRTRMWTVMAALIIAELLQHC